VPSNMLAARYGAPSQLTRIMLLWGAVMVSMMFARDAWWLAAFAAAGAVARRVSRYLPRSAFAGR